MKEKYRYYRNRRSILDNLRGEILDVGCNEGDIHAHLECLSRTVYGMDLVMTRYRGNVVRADAQHIPFKNETFDGVFAGEILEHLEIPADFLREAERVLKPGGRLILTTPNIHGLSYIKSIVLRKESLSDFVEHIYGWDVKLLRNFFQRLNLRLEVVEYGYADDGGLKIHIRALRRLRPDFAWFIYVMARKI